MGLYENIARHIQTNGRSIMSVGPDATSLGFTYTIGNSLSKVGSLPELIVVGLRPEVARAILNEMSETMVAKKRPFFDRELVALKGGKHPVMMVACHDDVRDEYTLQAGRFLQSETYGVMQVVLPDPEGCFPPNCAEPYRSLPYLGKTVQ